MFLEKFIQTTSSNKNIAILTNKVKDIIGYINSPANQENTNSLSNQRENSEQAV